MQIRHCNRPYHRLHWEREHVPMSRSEATEPMLRSAIKQSPELQIVKTRRARVLETTVDGALMGTHVRKHTQAAVPGRLRPRLLLQPITAVERSKTSAT